MPNYNQRNNNYPRQNNDWEAEINKIANEFNPSWISDKADESMIEFADRAGNFMAPKNKKEKEQKLSMSQIRNIYGEVKRIQVSGFIKEKTSFLLLKPKVAYACGRKRNNSGLLLFKKIFDLCYSQINNEKTFINFCGLFEALIAYHKFYSEVD